MMIDKERSVRKRGNKTYGLNKGREALKPCMWSLFETIERFLKKTNMVGIRRVFKTERLLTVDGLLERTMKKGIFTSNW